MWQSHPRHLMRNVRPHAPLRCLNYCSEHLDRYLKKSVHSLNPRHNAIPDPLLNSYRPFGAKLACAHVVAPSEWTCA
jgi:hypothetical protein